MGADGSTERASETDGAGGRPGASPVPGGLEGASGRLETRPIPRLLVQLLRRKVTGRLVVRDDSGDESQVFLREGLLVHVERPNDVDRLDRVLVESGLVSPAVLSRAEQMSASSGRRLGQVLVDLKALPEESLADVLRAQLRRKVIRLFFARAGTFFVHVEEHPFGLGAELASVRIDPRCLVLPGVRAAYDGVRASDELRALGGQILRVPELPAGVAEAMGFSPSDPVLTALRARPLRSDELASLGVRPVEAQTAILALHYADLLQMESAPPQIPPSRPRMTSPVPPSVAPLTSVRTMSPTPARRSVTPAPQNPQAVAELRAKVTDMAGKLDKLNLFEVLGVSESATPDQVQLAYMQAVRVYHPDKLAGAGLMELVKEAERIMGKLGEAQSVLSDPKRRAEYGKRLRGEVPEVDSAQSIIEAELVFKRGESALKRGDYAGAQAAFNEAARKNPAEPEYRAYVAWARWADPSARRDVISRETIRIVSETLKDRPAFALGHYWVGLIHKQTGDVDAAERSFRAAIAADKDFIDAEREIRLIQMRRSKGQLPPKSADAGGSGGKAGGFLARLLKR